VPQLIERKARLRLWDPIAREKFNQILPGLTYCDTPLECCKGADAVLILTEWPEVKSLDLDQLKNALKVPIVIDGRNVFEPDDMAQHGFIYKCVGREPVGLPDRK